MIHISLFSGIGGFELAAEWMGWRNYVSCDINEFGNKVRKHYWPDGYCHTDIKTLTYEIINKELSARYGSDWRDDDIIVTGGFPCQPYSQAGRRLGSEDERHLWPEMLRIISEVKPTYIVGENVYGLVNWSEGLVFEEVCAELEGIGYEIQPILLPASGIGAPHHRMRVWFVAKNTECDGFVFRQSNQEGTEIRQQWNACTGGAVGIYLSERNATHSNRNESKSNAGANGEEASNLRREDEGDVLGEFCRDGDATNTESRGQEGLRNEGESTGTRQSNNPLGSVCGIPNWDNFPTQSPICSGDDGLPTELHGITFSKWRQQSIMAYGNAVCPQLVYQIFKAIDDTRRTNPSST